MVEVQTLGEDYPALSSPTWALGPWNQRTFPTQFGESGRYKNGRMIGKMPCCWLWRWRNVATSQGMRAASRSQKRQSTVSSRASRRKGDLANTLTSAQWDCWRTFNLQKCKIIHLCYFKPSNLWQFVIMAIGNEHILQTQEFWELLFYGISIKEDKKLYTWFKTVYCYWIYYWIHWLCYW